jgi:hypothetical protein
LVFYPCPIDANEKPIDSLAGHANSAATHFRGSVRGCSRANRI